MLCIKIQTNHLKIFVLRPLIKISIQNFSSNGTVTCTQTPFHSNAIVHMKLVGHLIAECSTCFVYKCSVTCQSINTLLIKSKIPQTF